MQLWFARNGSISIRDQLVTQLMLAVASGELDAGKRLPSTRALARRYQLHPNTVSAAYQQLEELGWVESVRGSGVYVRAGRNQSRETGLQAAVDELVLEFLREARGAGLTAAALRARMDYWLALGPRGFVFVHPDHELRSIICQELRQALNWEVLGSDSGLENLSAFTEHSVFLSGPSKHAEVRALVPAAAEVVPIQMRSVADSLAPYLPARPEKLMVIASGWPTFLEIARNVLAAAGYDPATVLFCDTKDDDWRRCVVAGSVVVCDLLTAESVSDGAHKIVFRLIADAAIAGLKTYEQFYGG